VLDEQALELEFESGDHEVAWIGDPAVDLDRVDAAVVEAWRADGEARHLPVRPKEKLSRIKWRPLDRRERDEAVAISGYRVREDGEIDAHGYLALMVEMTRFGLVSVEGLRLGRDRYHGVRGLDDATMRRLAAVRIGPQPEGSPIPEHLGLLPWLGGRIAEATFREGR
jgi:hypothetical protein